MMIAPSLALGVFLGRQSLQGKLKNAQDLLKNKEDLISINEARHRRELELQRISDEELVRRVIDNLPIYGTDPNEKARK